MKQNNEWRRRIIHLLEDLLKNLQCRPPSFEQAAIFDEVTALGGRADSMFEGLEGVEVTESLYYTKPIQIPIKAGGPIYRLKDCLEDTAFAVYCFLQDATYLRLFSARAWHDFALGKIGIQTATFCTNSVDAHIGKMTEELRKTFDHFNDTWMTRMHTKLDAFLRQQCGDDARISRPLLDQIKPKCEDVSFARHAHRRLGYYASTLTCAKTTRLLFKSFLANQNPSSDVSMDEFCLLKSLYQLRSLEGTEGDISLAFRRDCMHYAAQALVLGHIDSDAVFAAQMLRDIQQQVSPQSIATEDILEQTSQDYLNLYETYGPIWKQETFSATQSTRTDRMYERYRLLHAVVNSPNKLFMQDLMEQNERKWGREYNLPGFQLLRHVPSLIGQLAIKYNTEFQNDFMDIANDQGHILTAVHFYNAAKLSGALQAQRWADMEWVLDRQTHIAVFAGDPPTTTTDCVRQFCLAYGLDSCKFAANRKLRAVERVKNDIYLKGQSPRRLESCSQLVKLFAKGILPGMTDSSGDQVATKVTEAFANSQLDLASPHGKPNQIGMLIAAKESFECDEEALAFDIFDLSCRCARLLTDIRDMCVRSAPNDYPLIRFGGDAGVNATLAELLRDLTNSPRHHEKMWAKAVKLMSDMIDQEGSRCVDLAFERMKMTTMDSISMSMDTSSSDSDTAIETPLFRPSRVDPETDGTSNVFSMTQDAQDNANSHDLGQNPQDTSVEPSSEQRLRAYLRRDWTDVTEDDERQYQQCLLDMMNSTVRRLDDGSSQLIGPDGTPIATWGVEDTDHRREENFVKVQELIRECHRGTMTMDVLDDGNMEFFRGGKLKVLVTLPNIEFHVFD